MNSISNAIVYCEGAFGTPNGKTAHGLVRFSHRFHIVAVIDSRHAGKDAGDVLDQIPSGIPVVHGLNQALDHAEKTHHPATHFVIGLAPDGGRLPLNARQKIRHAIENRLHIVCGLHDYLTDDPELVELALTHGVTLTDVRKPPKVQDLHFFSGKIEEVTSLKVALLGTDSAVGKRTTAWKLVQGLQEAGISAEMVGTGQTAWMQGVKHGIIMDSLINDFVSGEIEHAVWSAWNDSLPDVVVIEGQGSLLNPAYPGGFEILAAGRPDIVVLQHAPMRREYDGFPGYELHPLDKQIAAIEMISGKPVVAITLNHELIPGDYFITVCDSIGRATNLPVTDVLLEGPERLVNVIRRYLDPHSRKKMIRDAIDAVLGSPESDLACEME